MVYCTGFVKTSNSIQETINAIFVPQDLARNSQRKQAQRVAASFLVRNLQEVRLLASTLKLLLHNIIFQRSTTKGRGLLAVCAMASHVHSHAEIWDDSMLIDSWNEALDEYKVTTPNISDPGLAHTRQHYHSMHARGEKVQAILKEAETQGEKE
jgi:hypothetical protein